MTNARKRKQKPLVQEWVANNESEIQAAKNGYILLFDSNAAVVKYMSKKWRVKDLLLYLAKRVQELELEE